MAGWRRDLLIDDLTGLPLPPESCKAARMKDVDYFRSKGIWEIKTLSEAGIETGRRPISIRWVETNQGDDDNPNIRSRPSPERYIGWQGKMRSSPLLRHWSR